jgi:type I restriction enzyme M protein
MTLAISQKTKDILSYESEVWTSADILRSSVGLKASDFPDFMMPFFALRLVESRLIRKYAEICQDTSLTTEEDRIEEIKDSVGFYNSMVIEKKITLADIVQNDKTFYQDFRDYLNSFDQDLQSLLGIINSDKTENLDIDSKIDSLRKKNVLFGYTSAWAKIDFTPYDNGEVTTLEEHIKRKWADMSAETAGEQYTPYDIFNLIAELITTKKPKEGKINSIYDMTCGGANMLFGIEDRLKSINLNIKTETYGQELRGSLFALAKIEAMFRKGAYIEQGNTLTEDKFPHKSFDFGVANPPYGVSWKEEQKTIENDQTGRFGHGGYPSVSDGQLLFIQHMLAKLNETGVAFIVLNGSPLFSGDAGSGESNIRKWILDNDWLECLIQLPTNEFFNTGITTYIWCLNKNKPEDRKDKILCINAEDQFVKLKKNKGDKSKEINLEKAKYIADIYENCKESEISKLKSKYDFYFNKQSLKKLEKDDEFGAFNNGKDSVKLTDIHTIYISSRNEEIVGGNRITTNITVNTKEEADKINALLKNVDNDEQQLSVISESAMYRLDENHCIIETKNGVETNLGYGDISIKAVYKKATAKAEEKIVFDISLNPVWTKDDEKIEYSPIEEENQAKIAAFMKKWVSEDSSDYQLLGNVVGVEINFNSVFPKKIEIRSTSDILADIDAINKELGEV